MSQGELGWAPGLCWGATGPGLGYRLSSFCSRATLICAWAEQGADALGPDGKVLHSDAFPPPRVVDTLGAGDTFNASVIFSLAQGECPQEGRAGPVLPRAGPIRVLCLSRENHAGGSAVRLPGGRQEVWPAGLRWHRVSPLHPCTSGWHLRLPDTLPSHPTWPETDLLRQISGPAQLGTGAEQINHLSPSYFLFTFLEAQTCLHPSPL